MLSSVPGGTYLGIVGDLLSTNGLFCRSGAFLSNDLARS